MAKGRSQEKDYYIVLPYDILAQWHAWVSDCFLGLELRTSPKGLGHWIGLI